MTAKTFIETDRLLLREWIPADDMFYINMNRDESVMEFFPSILTEAQSLMHTERITGLIKEKGYGLFAVERKEDSAFIGFTGFSHPGFEASFTPCVEIGWRIGSKYWNKGYATEAAKACIDFGFEKMGWKDIYSFTSLLNTRSENVMKKIGMNKESEFNHPLLAEEHPLQKHVLYKISQTKQP
jgi:RimJ/RimL family protein N-acetyltransferase